ncbi:MAG: DUF2934 domain-containing protein [Planctomycetota bacterium]|nr:DUF2934 domain-containing protein [Planctomycetota bacterium]
MPDPHYAASFVYSDLDCHIELALRVRAYELWENAGRPDGLDPVGKSWADHFWQLAEAELHAPVASERKGSLHDAKKTLLTLPTRKNTGTGEQPR